MLVVVNQVIVLSFLIMIGYYARKKCYINPTVNQGLAELLINITMPFMILVSFTFPFSPVMFHKGLTILAISFGVHIFLILLGKLLYGRKPLPKQAVLRFVTVFSNCAFMGYPVLLGLYGKIGIFYASIFTLPFNIFMWTIGVMLFNKDKNNGIFKQALKSPPLVAIFLGIMIFMFSIPLPKPIYTTLDIVGNMTTPLSMIIIGAMLAGEKLKDVVGDLEVYKISVMRLLVIPLILIGVLKLCHVDPLLLNISVILEAMPAAAIVGVLAQRYDGDTSLASKSAFLTTILSLGTIPFILYILMMVKNIQ